MSELKSVIEIDVEDSKFKEFQEAFGKYQEALESMPDEWKSVGGVIAANADKVDKSTQATGRLKNASDRLKKDMESGAKHFTGLVNSSLKLAKNVAGITVDLAKWVSLSSIALGAGGAFGFGKLAKEANSLRKEAQGLDAKPEELQSAEINLSRALANPLQSLAKLQQVQADLSQRWAFNALRVNPEGKDTAQVQAEIMKSARTFWSAMPQQQRTTQTMQAYGLDKFFSLQELNRMATMRDKEFQSMMDNYESDKRKLALSDETLRKWQDLNRQFDQFKNAMQNDLIKAFEGLAPSLKDFSQAVEEAFKTLTGSDQVRIWIEDAGRGIKEFSKYLTSPEFKTDLSSFLESMDRAGGAIWRFASSVAKVVSAMGGDEKALTGSQYEKLEEVKKSNPELGAAAEKFLANPSKQTDTTAMAPMAQFIAAYNAQAKQQGKAMIAPNDVQGVQSALVQMQLAKPGEWDNVQPAASSLGINAGANPVPEPGFFEYNKSGDKWIWNRKFQNELAGLDFQAHWDMGLLDRLYYAESSRGKNRLSSSGARGGFGFMPDTAKEYGLTDFSDDRMAAKAAQKYLMKLRDQFGDMEKAVAAYNYGPGNLSKLLKSNPNDWRQQLPKETQREIQVVVYNNTGGNAATSINQVAK